MTSDYGVFLAGFFTPYYVTLDVRDGKVVDEFLDEIERYITDKTKDVASYAHASGISAWVKNVSMKTRAGSAMRGIEFRIGPWRYHIYYARVDRQLIVTNQPYVFDDLRAAAKAPRPPADAGSAGHALIRFRPQHWNQALTGYRIGWAANNREACVKNLGILSGVARADKPMPLIATVSWHDRERQVLAEAVQRHGVHCTCPEGGRYKLAKDGKSMECTAHGAADNPVQSDAPAESSPVARFMKQFADLSATLTFRDDGLQAVVILERK